MAKALIYPAAGRWPARGLRLLALLLILAANVLEWLAARVAPVEARDLQAIEREVGVVEIDGRPWAAIYEEGRLVAVLEQLRL